MWLIGTTYGTYDLTNKEISTSPAERRKFPPLSEGIEGTGPQKIT